VNKAHKANKDRLGLKANKDRLGHELLELYLFGLALQTQSQAVG
jgi:hypothetical protein